MKNYVIININKNHNKVEVDYEYKINNIRRKT